MPHAECEDDGIVEVTIAGTTIALDIIKVDAEVRELLRQNAEAGFERHCELVAEYLKGLGFVGDISRGFPVKFLHFVREQCEAFVGKYVAGAPTG